MWLAAFIIPWLDSLAGFVKPWLAVFTNFFIGSPTLLLPDYDWTNLVWPKKKIPWLLFGHSLAALFPLVHPTVLIQPCDWMKIVWLKKKIPWLLFGHSLAALFHWFTRPC